MTFNLLKLLAILTVWILKCFTSLPKLYQILCLYDLVVAER